MPASAARSADGPHHTKATTMGIRTTAVAIRLIKGSPLASDGFRDVMMRVVVVQSAVAAFALLKINQSIKKTRA